MGTSSNPGRINLKGDSARNEQVESQPITLTSTYTSTKTPSTQRLIRTSGAGKGRRKSKTVQVAVTEVAAGQFIDKNKTDYDSRICQIRTIDGKKCVKMAVTREEITNAPVCNNHMAEILREESALKSAGFVTALDLLLAKKKAQ